MAFFKLGKLYQIAQSVLHNGKSRIFYTALVMRDLMFLFSFFCSYLGKCRKIGTRNNSVSGHFSRSHGLTQARTLIPRVLPESLAPPSVQRYVIVLRT